jgi:hypothetical protein
LKRIDWNLNVLFPVAPFPFFPPPSIVAAAVFIASNVGVACRTYVCTS